MREEKYTDMSLTDEQLALIGITSLSMPEQYIQVKDVRYTLDEFNRIGGLLLGWNLTDDQQEVLEWLKDHAEKVPIMAISNMLNRMITDTLGYKVQNAYLNLTRKEQGELLQAFGAWAVEEEENENN